MAVGLPEGFVLDEEKPTGLPEGFVLDAPLSLGKKIERDVVKAVGRSINKGPLESLPAYGGMITDVAGDVLGSAAGPDAVATMDSAKQWLGDTWAGKAAGAVARNTPETVAKALETVSPALAVQGIKDTGAMAGKGVKAVSNKLGTASGNTFPNGVMSETAPNMAKGRGFPDTEEIMGIQKAGDDAVSEAYQGINATLRPEAEQALKGDLLNTIGSLQINPAASPKTIGAVKSLYDRITVGKINPITGDVVQAPLTVPEVDGFRRLLGNTAGEDAAAAGKMRSSIDKFLNNLDEKSFIDGGPQAINKLNAARATASRNFKLQTFSEAVKNADGNPNRIQKAAFNFLKDPENLAGLDAQDIAALKAVRDGAGAQKALQLLGKTGFDQNNVIGPLVGGALTAGVLPIAGTVARYGNKLAVRGAANKALESLARKK